MTNITRCCDARPVFFSKAVHISPCKAMISEIKTKLEYFSPLSGETLFCDLTPESFESLNDIKQTKRFRKGSQLFAAGDMPCCIYRLVKGEAQLFLYDESTKKRTVRPIGQDEIIGLTEAIANLPHETNAETVTPCCFECFGREDLIRFLHDEPQVGFRLVQMLGLKVQKSYQLFFSSIK